YEPRRDGRKTESPHLSFRRSADGPDAIAVPLRWRRKRSGRGRLRRGYGRHSKIRAVTRRIEIPVLRFFLSFETILYCQPFPLLLKKRNLTSRFSQNTFGD